jgi:hypothetical protein
VEAFACPKVVGLNLGHVGGIQSGVSRVWFVVGSTAEAVVSLLILGQKLDLLLCQGLSLYLGKGCVIDGVGYCVNGWVSGRVS